jgi:uncharacterized protein YgbK (DUF1537 family)
MSSVRLGWYGDDFTGATDTLAVLTQAGLRAMLFLGVPGERQLARAADAWAAPSTRSASPGRCAPCRRR